MHAVGVGRTLVVDHQHRAAGVALGVAAAGVDEVEVHAVVVIAMRRDQSSVSLPALE
jgi:hypothetical protein